MDDFQALELRLKDTEKDKKCVEKKYSQVNSFVYGLTFRPSRLIVVSKDDV